MRASKTFFEQVPLEIVRKITELPRGQTMATSNGLTLVNRSAANTEMKNRDDSADLQYPAWQKPCQEALVELDKDKLKERVAAAEAAVFQRLQELANSNDNQAERQALLDVTSTLRFLKRDALKFPDWESGKKVQ